MQINPINNSDSSRYTRPSFKQLIVDKELPLKLIGKVARNKEIAKLTEFLHKDGYDLHIYDYERLSFGFVAKKFELALYAKPIEIPTERGKCIFEGPIKLIPENLLFTLDFINGKRLYKKFWDLKSQYEHRLARSDAYEKESFDLIDALNKRLLGK